MSNIPKNPSNYANSVKEKHMLANTDLPTNQEKHTLTNSDLKEATLESSADIREKIREEIRNSLNARGPLYIPENLKDPGYQYIFHLYDSTKPYQFMSNLSLGYEHVTHSQMPHYKAQVGDYQGGFSMTDEGGKIGVKYSPTQTLYMMRIPKERYAVIQEIVEEKRQAPIQNLVNKPNEGNYFGEIAIGSGNFTTQGPQR